MCDFSTLKLLTDCSTEIGSIKDLLTIAGLLLAAYYGYRRFFHGRIYSERLKPSLSLDVVVDGNRHWLVADVEIENTGLRRTLFEHRFCDVVFRGVLEAPEADEYPFMEHEERFIASRPLFTNTVVIEPDEVSQDSTLVLVDASACTGYVAEFRISEEDSTKKTYPGLARPDSWVVTAYKIVSSTDETASTQRRGLNRCRTYSLEKKMETLVRRRSGKKLPRK